ncbi:MAG: lysophospholipid acyltransferase family protein [Halieaceae bacterium]|jgi:Kdo2-lipid IVA lauroyltransferase/acyltransferase|nr:lysophospholipid acyltransferase family protein [Halieaceae bacterium]
MNTLKTRVIVGLLYFCALLPLALARSLGRILGRIYWPIGGRSRKVTQRNIRAAFPELTPRQQDRLARRSIIATGELIAEMGHIWMRPWEYVAGLIKQVHGVELIVEAQEAGRGVIVLAPHLGNWEVVGLHAATLGTMISLFEPPPLPKLGSVIKKARERSGATLVPTDSRGLAKLLRSVKRGDLSGILPDQAPPELGSGENSPFMGVSCFTPTLASNMIRRTGALAVFCYARRIPGGFSLHYELAEPDIYNEDTGVSLAAMNRGVEACVRQCVEQYQWEYKRFRVRPRNGVGIYDDM